MVRYTYFNIYEHDKIQNLLFNQINVLWYSVVIQLLFLPITVLGYVICNRAMFYKNALPKTKLTESLQF